MTAPRPPSVADGRAACRDATRAAARDMLDDAVSFSVRAYAPGTRDTYLCAARNTLRGVGDAFQLDVAIDARLLVLGGRRRGRSVARNTLSAFKMLEDLQLLGRVVTPRMWLQVRAIDRSTAHLAAPRIWATGTDLERLGRYPHHWSWARTFFAVTCAAVYALRVGDVASFSWDGIATPKWLTFWDQKVNAEWVDVPLSRFLERWRAYVARLRRPDHLPTGLLFPGGTSTASECLRQLVRDTPSAHITWHPWKRFSAAAYMWLGGSSYGLQLWARWRSPKQARHYARHPPSWTLPSTLCLPVPARFSGSPARDMDWTVVDTRKLWPPEAWKPSNKRPAARRAPPAHIPTNHEHHDESSSSGEEAVDVEHPLPDSRHHMAEERPSGHGTSPEDTRPTQQPSASAPAPTPRPEDTPAPGDQPPAPHVQTAAEQYAVPPAQHSFAPVADRRAGADPQAGLSAHQEGHQATSDAPPPASPTTDLPADPQSQCTERRLFLTPSTPPPPGAPTQPDHPHTPGEPRTPSTGPTVGATSADALHTPVTPRRSPLPATASHDDVRQSPGSTSPWREPQDMPGANNDGSAPMQSDDDCLPMPASAVPEWYPAGRSAKRTHVPTGTTPAPDIKVRAVDPSDRQPPTDQPRQPAASLPVDHAPFCGYDLLAPRRGTRFCRWHPGPMPLPPVDDARTRDRFTSHRQRGSDGDAQTEPSRTTEQDTGQHATGHEHARLEQGTRQGHMDTNC